MEAIKRHRGVVVGIDRENIDTDQIIPKQFLKKIEKSGFGRHLFHDWRFLDDDGRQENPDFILNQTLFRKASILIAGDNFGSGSSREHAPWALLDFGFRVIIAPSFADIFYNNCSKNGILPVSLGADEVRSLFEYIGKNPGAELMVDLEQQKISAVDGEFEYRFEIDKFRRENLLKGLDEIDLTLERKDEIAEFTARYRERRGFLFAGLKK